MTNLKFVKEKQLISDFFDHIAMGDNLVVYGVSDTMKLIESGAVGKIVCYEDLNYIRLRLRNSETDAISSIYIKPEQITNPDIYKDK